MYTLDHNEWLQKCKVALESVLIKCFSMVTDQVTKNEKLYIQVQ